MKEDGSDMEEDKINLTIPEENSAESEGYVQETEIPAEPAGEYVRQAESDVPAPRSEETEDEESSFSRKLREFMSEEEDSDTSGETSKNRMYDEEDLTEDPLDYPVNSKTRRKLERIIEKERRKREKAERRRERRANRKGGFFGKLVAAFALGILFGAAAFGAFYLGMKCTGYEEKLNKALSAADEVEAVMESLANKNIAEKTEVVYTGDGGASSVKAVYDSALPSVVSILNVGTETVNYGFFSREEEVSGSGSGAIIGTNDTELLVVTNYHVVENATALTVIFVDDAEVPAYVKGTDPENDLAVLAVLLADMDSSTKASIAIAKLAGDSEVSVGEQVVAIGNALGYGQSMTVGYISALNRQVKIDGNVMTMLQTDAAINPGNSGGPLLNMEGNIIGINSAKYMDTNVEGMGFAIPISLVRDIIDELSLRETKIKVPEEEMGYLGVTVTTLPENNLYGMPGGAYVRSVGDQSPAAIGGLQEGDIIIRLDDIDISGQEELLNALAYYRGGTTVTLKVMRLNNGRYEEVLVEITLAFRKDYVSE